MHARDVEARALLAGAGADKRLEFCPEFIEVLSQNLCCLKTQIMGLESATAMETTASAHACRC